MTSLRRLVMAGTLSMVFALPALAWVIRGTVADKQGEPLVGATVRLLKPDSTRVGATIADADGRFAITNVSNGRYILLAEYVGSTPQARDVTVKDADIRVKKMLLEESATTLKEAVVEGIRTPMKVMQDTVEFAAGTYKTQPNAVVEDLLKRLPGVEVSSDGKITANGKEVSKILVDGKEFFSDDPKVASKNLPVNMVDKLQVVDRKSDLARLTGVDDGEDETVINLTVKKGMKNGWFGQAEAGAGTDSRYMGAFTVNRFWNDNQMTLLGAINNTNEMGFSDGGSRFRRFGGSNGITTSRSLGINFNVGNKEIFRIGGDIMYSNTSRRTTTQRNRQYLFPDSTSYVNSYSRSRDRGHNVRADLRLQWNPNEWNTFEFRPRMSFNVNDSWSADTSLTTSGTMQRVTYSRNAAYSHGKSWEFGGEVIYNHKFANRPGRSFSVQARLQTSNVRERENSWSRNEFFLLNDSIDLYDQVDNNHTWSNTFNTRVSWTEPLGDVKNGNFLTFAYSFRYRWNNADKMVYDDPEPRLWVDGWLGDYGSNLGALIWNQDLSNQFRNDYMNQDIRAGFKHVTKSLNLDVGLSLVPQMSKSVDLINHERDIRRNVLNFAPYMRYRWRITKTRSLMVNYRGRSSQPSISQMQPVADMSNPLRIVVGNPDLDPTFSHNIQMRFNDFNPQGQRSFMLMANAQVSQNAVVSRSTFNRETGGQVTTYENVNGVWNMMMMGMFSTPLENKSWTVNAHAFARYSHDVGFSNGSRMLTRDLNINIMPSIAFRPDNLELEVRPRYSFQQTRSSVQTGNNRTVHSYGGMFNGTYYAPFGLVISTDLNWAKTSGYSEGYNSNQCLWNATLSYQFLRDRSLTVSAKAYDLLQQRKSIMRQNGNNYIDDTMYNSLTRYFMFTVAWKFNTFGKGNEPESRNRGPWGGPGGRGGRPGPPPGHGPR
ncbi:MAG: TonB-dependent receptor [Bacteroidales bacterium]|nr:TonB-dependent receptor [Bacteroidales bacterium]